MKTPSNDAEYRILMNRIKTYLQRATAGGGFDSLTADDAQELAQLSLAAEAWEDSLPLMPIKMPQTIVDMIKLKMYQKQLKQGEMARLLNIPATRLSEVLQGKRRISLDLAKRLHTQLDIDAEFILAHA